jgi:uncharacterized protein
MRVRRPSFDFANTSPHWARDPEFSQTFNASSLWIPHLERFLNRVMAKCATVLPADDAGTPRLRGDIKLFIRQEAMHYTNHAAFNAILSRAGYDIAGFERHFEAEFERLFTTKSLGFLSAYCEGFETMGPPAATVWLGQMDDVLEGADPEVVRLWKWHLMEEFEHRTVCYDVFHAVHGGYFMRIYGLAYQFIHLGRFSGMVLRHLLERDRANMTPAQIKISKKRARAAQLNMMKMLLPRTLRAMLPFYSPRKAPEPAQYRTFMAHIEGL